MECWKSDASGARLHRGDGGAFSKAARQYVRANCSGNQAKQVRIGETLCKITGDNRVSFSWKDY